MKTQAKGIFLSLIILAASTVAMAQPPGGQGGRQGMRGGEGERMEPREEGERMAKMLDLSDAQKEQMKAIKTATQIQMLPLKNALGEKEAKLKTLQTASDVNIKAIENQIDEIGTVKIKMAKIKARSHQNVRALLTDEQRVKLDTKFTEGRKQGKKPARGTGK